MQGYKQRQLTDKEARQMAMEAEDDLIYIHKGSGHIRRAYYNGDIRKRITVEEAKQYSVYLGFEPVAGAYGTY